MARIDIEQIKADREAGTQGPWELRKIDVPCMSSDDREAWEIIGAGGACVTDTQYYYPEPLSEVDIRRVSRLDDLEAALIEAVELLRDVVIPGAESDWSSIEGEFNSPVRTVEDAISEGCLSVEHIAAAHNFLERFK